MIRAAVVYDTNVYRRLAPRALFDLVQLEKQRGVAPYANYIVVTEYLAHVADEADPDFSPSLAALKRLATHCATTAGADTLINFLADTDSQVAFTILGAKNGDSEQPHPGFYSELIGAIANGNSPADWHRYASTLSALREKAARIETAFVDGLWRNVVLGLQPDAASWADVQRAERRGRLLEALSTDLAIDRASATILERLCAKTGRKLSPSDAARADLRIKGAFGTAVRLHVELVRRLIESGADMTRTRNRNFVWDYQIVFCTAPGSVVSGAQLWLITDDQAIIRAAGSAGADRNIMSLDTYQALLATEETFTAAGGLPAP